MKKQLLLGICILLCIRNINAQITLEHLVDSTTMNGGFYCTDIGGNDYKYVLLNAQANSFSLYNMDMTPYMADIVIPVTDSIMQGFTVIYVTKALFDCDSTNIEYVFTNAINQSEKFRVLRTDGTVLLEVDSATGPYCFGCWGGAYYIKPIINTSAGAKLFLQKYPPSNSQIFIYALCGELPISVYDFSENKTFVNLFPNPADMKIHLEINPPNNFEEFQVRILDGNGKELENKNIDILANKYSLDVRGLTSGTYFYSLVSNTKVYQSGKFIVTK
ncbi:MAG: T9SS type A sorting domain-containing protein [Chitinophagales bacterium]|nr:T9SS type A sorting domain-containing protein [Chitinophagales bacterium]